LLDRRLELTGMRADGNEFPVEPKITRPGPRMLTGYLRDITERGRAEAELWAPRARIADAADHGRRRLDRIWTTARGTAKKTGRETVFIPLSASRRRASASRRHAPQVTARGSSAAPAPVVGLPERQTLRAVGRFTT